MPLLINVIAREQSNAIRDALSTPPSSEDIARSFAFAERGTFANPDTHSRTALNGGWIGTIAITRNADGTVEAQRTWALDDAQITASGLTNTTAVQQFAQRLADDVHVKLIEWASRNRGGQMGDFWTVVATPAIAGVPAPVPTDAGWSTGKKVGAVVVLAGVAGAIIYAARK